MQQVDFNPANLNAELKAIWDDDVKMQSLFASFPCSRSINPASYDAKLDFWIKIFQCYTKDQISVNIDNIHLRFKRNNLTPCTVQVLIEHLKNNGELLSKSSYLSWTGWALHMIAPSNTTEYLYAAESMIQYVKDKALYSTDYTLSIEELATAMPDLQLTDLEIVLIHLSRSNNAVQATDPTSHQRIIKFALKSNRQPVITSTDFGVVKLKQTVETMHCQTEYLRRNIETVFQQCKACISSNQKEKARYHLRKRKALESILEKRLTNLETVELVYSKIHQATCDAQLLEAYKDGSETLAFVLEANNLTVEHVESTMDIVHDTLADQSDIERAMNAGSEQVSDQVDLQELEEELNALIITDEKEKNLNALFDIEISAERNLARAPRIPQYIPSVSSKLEQELPQLEAE